MYRVAGEKVLLTPFERQGKDVPDLMCCMKGKTEARDHIAFTAKCHDSCTMNNRMITDVQVAVFANMLGVSLFLLVVLDHYVAVNTPKEQE